MRVYELVWGVSISIHALLAESDIGFEQLALKTMKFLSTLSLRRATVGLPVAGRIAHRISIHALLAESDEMISIERCSFEISIHALLAESDRITITADEGSLISIHALLAESDWLQLFLYYQDNIFLSTLSLRRATKVA